MSCIYTTHFPPLVGRICFRVRVRLGIEKNVRWRTCHSLLVNAACWPRVGINVVSSARGPCLDLLGFAGWWLVTLDRWQSVSSVDPTEVLWPSQDAVMGCSSGFAVCVAYPALFRASRQATDPNKNRSLSVFSFFFLLVYDPHEVQRWPR